MNDTELYSILREEIKPALGCTGPIAICFCAAQAYDAIGGEIKSIDATLDWCMSAKNDDVAFPGCWESRWVLLLGRCAEILVPDLRYSTL